MATRKSKPTAHQKVIGKGSVTAKRTERVNPAQYGGEDSIKPASATSGTWKKTGTTASGHSQYAFQDDAMFKTGRVKSPTPKKTAPKGTTGRPRRAK